MLSPEPWRAMGRARAPLTGIERQFDSGDIIVSKTDLKGRITYCNRTLMAVSGYDFKELNAAPHNILRHPDMPRCVFSLLWEKIQGGAEVFAYVVNRAKCGDHYWVLAHVTPSRDRAGAMIGYHSSRRVPNRGAIETIVPIYRTLLDIEARHSDPKDGLSASGRYLGEMLEQHKVSYEEFVFSL